jgi:putative ABC transport system ATP-binding protein
MIALEDVDLTLPSAAGPVHILRGLSLSIARGETVSVVGPSGSGKSSMMMVIAGLERATSGRVVVCGAAFSGLDEDDLARFRCDSIGIVFQDYHLVPTMTARENVAIPLELAGRDDAFARAEVADEPTGNLDRETGAQVIELLFDLQAAHGTTMVLITHDPEVAVRCRRGLRMVDGRIVEQDAASAAAAGE